MSVQPLFLLKVDAGENNNKFYRMIPEGSMFKVEYGRVGNPNFQTMQYPISMWNTKLNEKLRKGYVDQTRLMAEVIIKKEGNKYSDITNQSIASIVAKLQSFARQAIQENYTISSAKVTQKMIDEAQALIGEMNRTKDSVDEFNRILVELFRTIPRKMQKVYENLAYSSSNFERILNREQDLLDVMRGQVVQQNIVEEDIPEENVGQTILDALGLDFYEVDSAEINLIKNQLGGLNDKFSNAWKVVNRKTQSQFDKYVHQNSITNKKLLWHGSRSENWWSIINSGLVLRPNAVTTGKMFGYGIYFAPSAQKSFGYTSYSGSYWARGNANVAYMSLFEVAYGTPYDVYSFESRLANFNYEALQRSKAGANCLHAHAGSMLRNDEIVVYLENQITIKYLVELK